MRILFYIHIEIEIIKLLAQKQTTWPQDSEVMVIRNSCYRNKLQNSYQISWMACCGVVAWLTWVGCVDGQADTVALMSFGDEGSDNDGDDDDEFW